MDGKKSEVKGQIHRPCAFIGIGNSEQEMQQLSLEDKVCWRSGGGGEGGACGSRHLSGSTILM